MHVQRIFLYNLYVHGRKIPFAPLFGGRKHRGKFNFFSESELGCGPQDSVGKRSSPVFAILRELTAINAKNFLKNRAFILIARDVFVALAVVVAKAPYIHESDSAILILLQAEKYPDTMDKLFILQNFANLQGIEFKIYRDLTKSAPFQFGFTRSICST